MTCIKEVLLGVVVGGGGDDYKVGILVRGLAVQRGGELQGLFGQIFLDIFVLDGTDLLIDLLYFLRNHVHSHHVMVLC